MWLAILSGALSIGSTILGASAQNKTDRANKAAAKAALKIQNRDISMRSLQEKIAAAQESAVLNMQAGEATADTAASAAAGNVGGMTVDMLLQDVENTRLSGQGQILQQRDQALQGLDLERSGALATSRGRANQTSRANPFAVGLRIGGGALDAYTQYRYRNPLIIPGDKP